MTEGSTGTFTKGNKAIENNDHYELHKNLKPNSLIESSA